MEDQTAAPQLPAVIPESKNLTSRGIKEQVQLIQQVMRDVMIDKVHYGIIPGCGDKPTLLKAGAEKIAMMFRLSPTFEIIKSDLGDGHREYEVKCSLTHATTGCFLGQGVGSCSTMEKKYRYRYETDPKNPQKKIRVENPDIADQYNTVLKMAKKRAQIDATLTATGASDIFAQDLDEDDIPKNEKVPEKTPPAQPQRKSEAGGRTISEPQANRLFAIASNAGYSSDQIKDQIGRFGYQHSNEIPAAQYNEIVASFEARKGEPGAAG